MYSFCFFLFCPFIIMTTGTFIACWLHLRFGQLCMFCSIFCCSCFSFDYLQSIFIFFFLVFICVAFNCNVVAVQFLFSWISVAIYLVNAFLLFDEICCDIRTYIRMSVYIFYIYASKDFFVYTTISRLINELLSRFLYNEIFRFSFLGTLIKIL